MDNVGQVVGQVWYTPQSYSVLNAAIIKAGLRKRDQLPTYAKFVEEFDRTTAELEERGIMSKRVSVNAASLLEWCADHGLSPDADARAQYIRFCARQQSDAQNPRHAQARQSCGHRLPRPSAQRNALLLGRGR